jgi:hypothetical protein
VDEAPAGRVVGALTSEVAVSVSNNRSKLKNCQKKAVDNVSAQEFTDKTPLIMIMGEEGRSCSPARAGQVLHRE